MKPQPSDRPMPHDLAAERAVLKFTANGPTPVWGPTAAWVSKAIIDVRKRDEAHVRAELARLGISGSSNGSARRCSLDETKRWSEGVVGFGSGSDPAELMERMQRDLRGLHGLHGVLVEPANEQPEVPKAPALNRRQRRELARRGRRR